MAVVLALVAVAEGTGIQGSIGFGFAFVAGSVYVLFVTGTRSFLCLLTVRPH